jgi:hypothetical protein
MSRLSDYGRAVVLSFTLTVTAVQAEEGERPAWLSEEVVTAAMNIGMSEDQLGPFRASVGMFLQDYREAADRIIRRGDAGIETSVQRARNSLAREMDKRMAKILTEAQMGPYHEYRTRLLQALTPE